MANLRILYNNIIDTASNIAATTTASGYPISNMQTDIKGQVWRSTSLLSNTITIDWATAQTIGVVVLPYTNLSSSATINTTFWTGAAGTGTNVYTTGTVAAVPYNFSTWGTPATGANAYSYGGGNAVRVYTPSILTNVLSVTITILDASNTQGYIEISRLVAGTYWSPTYNTEFGLSVEYIDQSSVSRAQSGNIITDIAPIHKVLNFTLSYLQKADRNMLLQIMKLNGMRKSLFISLFPSDTDVEKEFTYQIYGRLSSNPTITHPMFSQYTSSIAIEEV